MDTILIENIKQIILNSRKSIATKVNNALIETYWLIGKEVVLNEQNNKVDKQTSRQIILNLSKLLSKEIGRGFSRSNLFNMRKLYLNYPTVQTLSGHIAWSHLCELLNIENKEKRKLYEVELQNSNWSFREFKRQIDSSLYELLLLTEGKSNKKDEISAEYILSGLENKIFASKFTYVFPNKEKLINELEMILKQ